MAETTKAESPYQRTARIRWPGWQIIGDGDIARVNPNTGTVTLYGYYMLARVDMQPHVEKLYRLKPTYEALPRYIVRPGDREKE